MNLKTVTKENVFQSMARENKPWQGDYLAMYSSQWQGMVTDPDLMTVPIDDHLVHRGDGVFDVMRCVEGSIYQMEAHLSRLEKSAKAISLSLPPDYGQIRKIIKTLILAGGEKNCIIRVILSRGPGGFTTNPFESPSSQIYINVIRYRRPPEKFYREGVSLVTSRIPIKKSFFATIKSCNYLPNVLMKMEAINAGSQYAIALDEEGFLAEGSTENISVLSSDGILRLPGFEKTLAGITAKRLFELAETLIQEEKLQSVRFDRIPLEEAYHASEILLMGTSINILPVARFDGKPVGQGRPGPLYQSLSLLLDRDMRENRDLLTPISWDT
jgi:branched-subunit amino acid aminotransferase/4-amino-4-deoxychorismate lyase